MLIPRDGLLVGCAEDTRVTNVMETIQCSKVTYGINKGNFTTSNISYDSIGFPSFTVIFKGKIIGNLKLSVPGEHNILNSLAAIATCNFLGISFNSMAKSLQEFTGTHRRFEKKGEINGVTVIDEYAHHPVEIMASLKAAKNYPHGQTYCIFQPHTYSRTISLFNEFANAFGDADKLVLVDIYAARENDPGIINSEMLCDAVLKNGVDAVYASSFDDAIEYIKNNTLPGDLLITMGAGDVYKIGEEFLKR